MWERALFIRKRKDVRSMASKKSFAWTRFPNRSNHAKHHVSTEVIITPVSGSRDTIIAAITLEVSMTLEQHRKLFSLRYNKHPCGPTERSAMQFSTLKSKRGDVFLSLRRKATERLRNDPVRTQSTRRVCPKGAGPTTPLNKIEISVFISFEIHFADVSTISVRNLPRYSLNNIFD